MKATRWTGRFQRYGRTLRWLSGLLLAACLVAPAAGERPSRYTALLADGTRVEGKQLLDWHATASEPKLDDVSLLDPDRPLRWLRDRRILPSDPPAAFLETHTGDRLPGKVARFVSGNARPYAPEVDYFEVEPGPALKPPQGSAATAVRVVARFVRRIVWKPPARSTPPGTLVYADGRQVAFRAARLHERQATVLTADGPVRAAFDELAELHLPAVSFWEAYFDELQVLSPDLTTRLLQIESNDGLRVTASLKRFRAHVIGNPRDPSRWVHGLQPAWSLDLLWIANGDVWVRRSFAPDTVPLSRLVPEPINRPAILGRLAGWQANRNVRGRPLRTNGQEFGWGLGVHAPSRLRFPLHEAVRRFQSQVGLDAAAGRGGCVRFRVIPETSTTKSEDASSRAGDAVGHDPGPVAAKPLFESPILVGSDQSSDTGRLAIDSRFQSLLLDVDPVLTNRPAGADPFEIRDLANWLDPHFQLDPEVLLRHVRQRPVWHVPAWTGWQTVGDVRPEFFTTWDDLAGGPGAFGVEVQTGDKPLELERTFPLSSTDKWLLVAVSHMSRPESETRIQVELGGEPVADWAVAIRDRGHRELRPFLYRLDDYRGTDVPLTVRITQPAQSRVRWHAAAVVGEPPMLHELFDEDAAVAQRIESIPAWGPGGAAGNLQRTVPKDGVEVVGDQERHAGRSALRVAAGAAAQWQLPRSLPIRRQPRWGEYRYLRFAFRKQGGGRVAIRLDSKSAVAPAYDAGPGLPAAEKARRVWNQKLPDRWIVITRDLFAEFGKLDLERITLSVPDGEQAWFDHVYLARSNSDFSLPGLPAPSAEETNRLARRELAKPVLDRALPAVVGLKTADGRLGTGVLISRDGLVLTAGHLTVGDDDKVSVLLSTGKQLDGKRLGVDRQRDLGLVQAEAKEPLPFLTLSTAAELPPNLLYLGVAHRGPFAPGDRPAAHILGIRRTYRGTVWTDFDVPRWRAGGPLLDKDGRILGVHSRRSQYGGFLYTRTNALGDALPAMREGKTTGDWLPGAGPVLGVVVETTADGCRVASVEADGPAARAGVRPGDLLLDVDEQPVVSLSDIYEALSDRDPGQQVELRWQHGSQRKAGRIGLEHRVP